MFLGNESRIRTIDPLEITEIITDPDDIEHPMFYKREWSDAQGEAHIDYYRSYLNLKDKSTKDAASKSVQATEKNVLVYHLARGTGQRGSPRR